MLRRETIVQAEDPTPAQSRQSARDGPVRAWRATDETAAVNVEDGAGFRPFGRSRSARTPSSPMGSMCSPRVPTHCSRRGAPKRRRARLTRACSSPHERRRTQTPTTGFDTLACQLGMAFHAPRTHRTLLKEGWRPLRQQGPAACEPRWLARAAVRIADDVSGARMSSISFGSRIVMLRLRRCGFHG